MMQIPEGFPYASAAYHSSPQLKGLLRGAMQSPDKVKKGEASYLATLKTPLNKKIHKLAVLIFRLIHWLKMHCSKGYKTKFNRAIRLLERLFVDTMSQVNENPDGEHPFKEFIPLPYQKTLLTHVQQLKADYEKRNKASKKIQTAWRLYQFTHPKGEDGQRVSLREREINLVGLMRQISTLIKQERETKTTLQHEQTTASGYSLAYDQVNEYRGIITAPIEGLTGLWNAVTSSPRKSALEEQLRQNQCVKGLSLTKETIGTSLNALNTQKLESTTKVARLQESLQLTEGERTRLSDEWKALWASTQSLISPALRDPNYCPPVFTLDEQFETMQWHPQIAPLVEDVKHHGNIHFAFILGELFEGVGPVHLKHWTCDTNGVFKIELHEKKSARYWVESQDQRGIQDFAGGMVLFIGERKTGIIQGTITPDVLSFSSGFSAQVRTPANFQRLARRDFITANIVNLTMHGTNAVALNLRRYVGSFGTDMEKNKAPRTLRHNWRRGELLGTDVSASDHLRDKCP